LEHVEDQLRARGPSKRGRGKPKGKILSEEDLAKSVAATFEKRGQALESFRRWASPLGQSRDWIDAAVHLRQTTPDRLADLLARSIRKQSVALSELWEALDLETLHAFLDGPDIRGPAPRAFRLLLTTDGPLPAPHTFLLKQPALEAAKSLATAHRRFRTTLLRLYEKEPKLISLALKHNSHPVVFWGLTLLYNSRRKPLGGALRPAREYGPLPLPASPIWRQAWTVALAMDQPAVTALLVASYQNEQDQRKREPQPCTFSFYCPLDWKIAHE
jgi:hypothetical protein